MRKTLLTILTAMVLTGQASGQEVTTTVGEFLAKGPFTVSSAFQVDAKDAAGGTLEKSTLKDFALTTDGNDVILVDSVKHMPEGSLVQLSFYLDEADYRQVSVKVEGAKEHEIYLDGEKASSKLSLTPRLHRINLKVLSPGKDFGVSLSSDATLKPKTDRSHRYSIQDVLDGLRVSSNKVDRSGRYMIARYTRTEKGGKTSGYYLLTEIASGKTLARYDTSINPSWMPGSSRFYFIRRVSDRIQLVVVDPQDMREVILSEDLPSASFTMSQTEDFLIYHKSDQGRKDNQDVYEIINPEDRQPGWRNRSYIMKYDFKDGRSQRLTFSSHNTYLQDISRDGRKILFSVSHSRLTERPTAVSDYLEMDLETMKVDTIVLQDGFIASAQYSPDGKSILFLAGAESFDGVGLRIKPGQIASMVDQRLYVMDRATKKVTPLNPDSNINVTSSVWSPVDGMIYALAEDRDYVRLFSIDPKTLSIDLLPCQEEYITNFDLSDASPVISYSGQSLSNSTRLHVLKKDKKKGWTDSLVDDCSATFLSDVTFARTYDWRFDNQRGDSIYASYYLPLDFDPGKQYPMIVYYYGGCSPTSRRLESNYPLHVYSGQGYVVLVIQPSGATGFGQEFAARHVNTWGQGTAEDIIEGTKAFVREHSFVNPKKIGCVGASYGGFMTMYLQTKTDIFAAAVAHAGISNITSYWGEGYWGYTYSETASAGSYPWNAADMYTKQSPLFNADKIHTPILFTHGTADTNVPIGESIQMYTALRLLGRETAFIQVRGMNHHITDYTMRIRWTDSIMAWFAKHLKDDDSWWESIYPTTDLDD